MSNIEFQLIYLTKKRTEEERIENEIINQSFDTYYTQNPVNDSVTPKPVAVAVPKPVLVSKPVRKSVPVPKTVRKP